MITISAQNQPLTPSLVRLLTQKMMTAVGPKDRAGIHIKWSLDAKMQWENAGIAARINDCHSINDVTVAGIRAELDPSVDGIEVFWQDERVAQITDIQGVSNAY